MVTHKKEAGDLLISICLLLSITDYLFNGLTLRFMLTRVLTTAIYMVGKCYQPLSVCEWV